MKRCLLTVSVCFFLTFSALAQFAADQPASREDIQKYLEVMHIHDMMHQVVDAMAKPMQKMLHEQYLKDKDKLPVDFEARMNRDMNDYLSSMPWDRIIDATIPVYQKHLTKGDVNSLVAFYSSPTGQKMLHEMPAMMSDSMEAVMPIMRERMNVLQQKMQDEVAEMMKESQKTSGTAVKQN